MNPDCSALFNTPNTTDFGFYQIESVDIDEDGLVEDVQLDTTTVVTGIKIVYDVLTEDEFVDRPRKFSRGISLSHAIPRHCDLTSRSLRSRRLRKHVHTEQTPAPSFVFSTATSAPG